MKSALLGFGGDEARHPNSDGRGCGALLKWVGGKGKLVGQLTRHLPADWSRRRHVEPFAGGAGMFFRLAPSRAVLSDINSELMRTYAAVRDDVADVALGLDELVEAHGAATYYRVRERYNRCRHSMSAAELAATFIYLNKTCFNGLFRVNRRGEFNASLGRYRRVYRADGLHLRAASAALRAAELQDASDFESTLTSCAPEDFVYLDPPYDTLSPRCSASFTGYAVGGFTRTDQVRLREAFGRLSDLGCKAMVSNADTQFIRVLYRGFRTQVIHARRNVNSDAHARGPVREVVITNYGEETAR